MQAMPTTATSTSDSATATITATTAKHAPPTPKPSMTSTPKGTRRGRVNVATETRLDKSCENRHEQRMSAVRAGRRPPRSGALALLAELIHNIGDAVGRKIVACAAAV